MPRKTRRAGGKPAKKHDPPRLPAEVEVFVEVDGSVVFADLEAGLVRVAHALDPAAPMPATLRNDDQDRD